MKTSPAVRFGLGLLVWTAAWLLLAAGAGNDLAIGALLLVLATTLSAICWPLAATGAAIAASLLGFNWFFVPPRGSLQIALHQHALLLVTMALCGGLVAWLVAQQRRLLVEADQARARSEQLRQLTEHLRDSDDPLAALAASLAEPGASPPLLHSAEPARWLGEPSPHQRSGLQQCTLLGSAFGPGTGRHEGETDWHLPLRGRLGSHGAACLPASNAIGLHQAQALCDQTGIEMERLAALAQARCAQAASADQQLRNTLLAAIAHDHRTPLASILTAVSSLREQSDRLDASQRERLAAQIQGEAEQLLRITENSLQLARLGEHSDEQHGQQNGQQNDQQNGQQDSALRLRTDWESAEEMVGSVMQRLRRRDTGLRIKAYVEPGLPLLRCDAVLIVQLLDNLLDNALRHGGDGRIELRAERRQAPERLLLAVRDRGPGIAPAERDSLFEPFRRGALAQGRGAGVGLALCRAVAHAHGGQLRALPREGGGASFELELPLTLSLDEPPSPAD